MMARRGFAVPKAASPDVGPHPERLRKCKLVATGPVAAHPKAVPSPHSLPVRAAHPAASAASGPRRPGVPGRRLARRLPSRVPHNATDEGSKKNPHQSRLISLLLVFWLTSAIHRIFKELVGNVSILRRRSPKFVEGS